MLRAGWNGTGAVRDGWTSREKSERRRRKRERRAPSAFSSRLLQPAPIRRGSGSRLFAQWPRGNDLDLEAAGAVSREAVVPREAPARGEELSKLRLPTDTVDLAAGMPHASALAGIAELAESVRRHHLR